ncbi:MBL fold metallo-hydrolase [Chloroflexota bacterium]
MPGIHLLKIPIPESTLQYVNVYLIQGKTGYLLVDTGWNNDASFDSLQRQLKELKVSISDITRIAVTHIHPDHYGLVGKLKELSAAEFACHQRERDLIESRYIHMENLLQNMADWLKINGVPEKELPGLQSASLPVAKYVAPTYPDLFLRGGGTYATGIFTFQVLWTPGHSPGHVCLYEPKNKLLISGDHILPSITPNIGLHTQSSVNPLGDFLNSLDMIKKLSIRLVLPGHEVPFSGIQTRIAKIKKHHRQRNEEIMLIMAEKAKSAYQVAGEITWRHDVGGIGWKYLEPLHKRLAILETLSHLEYIRSQGKLAKSSRDGVLYYQRK